MTVAETIEALESRNLREQIPDIDKVIEQNQRAKRIIFEQNVGRPGPYYGRDVVIEGAVPVAKFYAAQLEFGGDIDWWKDDRKFQAYMRRNPECNWLKY
jgi:hypothetical protein